MFDIGTMELLVVAVVAIVVVGPKELPRVLKGFAQVMRTVRNLTSEFRAGVESLAAEVEREADPLSDLRKKEGLTPGMSPEQITEKIMANRAKSDAMAKAAEGTPASGGASAQASDDKAGSQPAPPPAPVSDHAAADPSKGPETLS